MTSRIPSARALSALSAGMIVVGTLSACTPAPEATPTATALFSSDEEAFRAAEETYRAYTKALNDVDTHDPETFEPVFSYSSGDFESRDRKNLSIMNAEGYVMSGRTLVLTFDGISTNDDRTEVVGLICLDVSLTDIQDESGQSLVASDRPDRYAATVTFVLEHQKMVISHAEPDEEHSCEA